ncbi:MAG: FAD-dependent monooxygenase [Segniliparus sp.]|uniref:FAD-dependent monooxygenase n=1 Tax=Segniliparus sp. TaxID=2804064 RepID=UPI003F3C9F53
MTETDVADVIVVGAGPTGLMLAGELRLAGVRTVVLDRLPQIRPVARAGGLGGRILDLLRYRGLLERFEAASPRPRPTPRFPFGGLHIDFTPLEQPPMAAVSLPQPQLEELFGEYVREQGAELRRGHEVVGLSQEEGSVTAHVRGPQGVYQASAQYLVGCDGVHSRIREMAGIAFPGVTCPEVERLASTTMPSSVTLRADGDYDVEGYGRLRSGYTQTEGGVFAVASYGPGDFGVYTSENEDHEHDDDVPMTLDELRGSIRRVLGAELPLGEPTRLTRFTFGARNAERYRAGRVLVAGDAAHQFPSGGVALGAGMLDAANLGWKLAAEIAGWAPDGLLDTYHDERHFAGERTLLHTQAQAALRRGHDPASAALRELFLELVTADEAALRRIGSLIAGSDIRYPAPGSRHPLAGAFAPDLALRADSGPTSVAELMRAGRPVFLDLAGRADLREVAAQWQGRVETRELVADGPPADALLIRPDAHIAWAAEPGEPAETAAPALRGALARWFGSPSATAPPAGLER